MGRRVMANLWNLLGVLAAMTVGYGYGMGSNEAAKAALVLMVICFVVGKCVWGGRE